MNDADQIARGIAEKIADIIWELPGGVDIRQKGVNLIAAALREYGEAEYKRGFDQGYVYADTKKAVAVGYRRGVEEAIKAIENVDTEMLMTKTLRPMEIARRELRKLQRGQGGRG